MIQPGLERIGLLLKNVEFPWKAIHVAGTNGKGSICTNVQSMLIHRVIPTGRFTSPHLIDRWDCIHINDKPVDEAIFKKVENHFKHLNQKENINASEFELLTATAFQLFNDHNVVYGVVEVGMGGKLDATNILQNQIVSVISKIALDHQNFLGNTLEEIARHKAGILRPNVPYIVNPTNEWNVQNIIDQVAAEVGAGPRLTSDSDEFRLDLFRSAKWAKFSKNKIDSQLDNTILACLAVKEALGCSVSDLRWLLDGLRSRIPGRYQSIHVNPVFGENSERRILVDGAHNEDAAIALNKFVYKQLRVRTLNTGAIVHPPPKNGRPVTWVMAMTDGKDARGFLSKLLRPGDSIVTTSFGPVDGMPWVKPMDPARLLEVAQEVVPDILGISIPNRGAHRAVMAAKFLSEHAAEQPIVLTGSLYFVGDFMREKADNEFPPEAVQALEREVYALLSSSGVIAVKEENQDERDLEKHVKDLEAELQKLDREAARLVTLERGSEHSSSESDSDDIKNVIPNRQQKALEQLEAIRRRIEGAESKVAEERRGYTPREEIVQKSMNLNPKLIIRKHFAGKRGE